MQRFKMFGQWTKNLNKTLNKNKKKVMLAVILVVAVFAVFMNSSYSYFERSVEGSCVSLEVGSLTYTNRAKITLKPKERKIFNLLVKTNDKTTSKYQLYYTSGKSLDNVVVGYKNSSKNLPYGEIAQGEEKDIELVLENNGSTEISVIVGVKGGLNNNTVDDIKLETNEFRVNEVVTLTLAEIVASKAGTSDTVNFAQISSGTNGRGVYRYIESGKDVYYYRGAVTDNHVKFAGFCWEMVRTTKTGGVKMIYDGEPDASGHCSNTGLASQLPDKSAFNPSYDDNKYMGYMYGITATTVANRCIMKNSSTDDTAVDRISTYSKKTACVNAGGKWTTTAYEATHANVTSSTIKKAIDTWYENNMLDYTNKLEDAAYCNDRSLIAGDGSGTGMDSAIYMAYDRLETNKIPSLECNNNDKFTVKEENGNGDLKYPVGLLTADEIALAGGSYNHINKDYYIYTGQGYWGITPYQFYGSYGALNIISIDGVSANDLMNSSYGVRPVITLLSNATPTGGNGSEQNPYVVE